MQKIIKNAVLLVFSLIFVTQAVGQLDLSPPSNVDVTDPPGQTIVIPLNLTNGSAVAIDAFGVTFTYPTDKLTFSKILSTGTLTDGWQSVGGQENTSGEITIGGFNASPTTTSGVLVNVEFIIDTTPGVGLLQLGTFIDDLANASTTPGILNSSVPVELTSFSAEILSNAVKLNWLTASETNNFGFEIEKSFDDIVYEKIGFVNGHGTTTSPQRYRFEDQKLNFAKKLRYYRLKQIDTDGSFEYSGSLKVTLAPPDNFVLQQNYPNPFNPETSIGYQLPKSTRVKLVIFNLIGQEIRNLVDSVEPAGFHKIIWNGKDNFGREVPSGTYIYQLKTAEFTGVKKMTLLR
ncbi:MAG: FlgD immunoglobulin-like domain containing protein [bacterium]